MVQQNSVGNLKREGEFSDQKTNASFDGNEQYNDIGEGEPQLIKAIILITPMPATSNPAYYPIQCVFKLNNAIVNVCPAAREGTQQFVFYPPPQKQAALKVLLQAYHFSVSHKPRHHFTYHKFFYAVFLNWQHTQFAPQPLATLLGIG